MPTPSDPSPDDPLPPEKQEMLNEFMAHLHGLTPGDAAEAILGFITRCFPFITTASLREMRAEIVAQPALFPPDLGIVQDTLDLIDGNLALRELGMAPGDGKGGQSGGEDGEGEGWKKVA